jgi:hypothetical protein
MFGLQTVAVDAIHDCTENAEIYIADYLAH